MAFQNIGFHAALILDRLTNHRQVEEYRREEDQRRDQQDRENEERARRDLGLTKKRLSRLSERV